MHVFSGVTLIVLMTALEGAGASLTIGSAPAYPGTTVSIPVLARTSNAVVAAQFDVTFSPTRASLGDAISGRAAANHRIKSVEIAPGIRRVLVYSMNNSSISNRGALVNIPVTVSPQEHVGSGPITPMNAILATKEATAVTPVELIAGQVLTRPVNPGADGAVQFFLPSTNDSWYLIQASSNLVDWLTITNLQANADFMDLMDADAARYAHRFYRPISYEAAGEISAVSRNANGGFTFQLSGLNGRTYILQASTNLVNWTDLRTSILADRTLTFTNVIDPAFPYRFYRLKSGH